MKILRVLVSSPSDVRPERTCIAHAVRAVNRALEARGDPLSLRLYGWPEDVVPGASDKSPQSLIESQLRFDDCEIVIGIFWRRLGEPVPGGPPSGSVSEIRIAHEAWKVNHRPHILVYFNSAEVSADLSVAAATELVRLAEFKEEIKSRNILYWGGPQG